MVVYDPVVWKTGACHLCDHVLCSQLYLQQPFSVNGMVAHSGLLHGLEQHAFSTIHELMCVYGDPACPHRFNLQAVLTDDMKLWNAISKTADLFMEPVRIP